MPYHRMTLEYLAGFFDGEGSVGTTPTGGYRWSIAQKGRRGQLLIAEIRSFLLCHHGIRAQAYKAYRQDMYSAGVTLRESVVKLCRLLLPHLHIKKTEVEDLLRLSIIFPKMLAGTPAANLRQQEARMTRRGSSGY